MVRIPEMAIVDPTVDDGASGSSGGMEREIVNRQERGERRSIAATIVESFEGDLHWCPHLLANLDRQTPPAQSSAEHRCAVAVQEWSAGQHGAKPGQRRGVGVLGRRP